MFCRLLLINIAVKICFEGKLSALLVKISENEILFSFFKIHEAIFTPSLLVTKIKTVKMAVDHTKKLNVCANATESVKTSDDGAFVWLCAERLVKAERLPWLRMVLAIWFTISSGLGTVT